MFSEKGFIKWVIIDGDKNEYEKDFLRLIKTNLILYYMFQKGGNFVISREIQSKDMWREFSFVDSVLQVIIKEELFFVVEIKVFFFNLRSSYNSYMGNNVFRLYSVNGEGYGFLGSVLIIKKELE